MSLMLPPVRDFITLVLTATTSPLLTSRARTICEKAPWATGPRVAYPKGSRASFVPRPPPSRSILSVNTARVPAGFAGIGRPSSKFIRRWSSRSHGDDTVAPAPARRETAGGGPIGFIRAAGGGCGAWAAKRLEAAELAEALLLTSCDGGGKRARRGFFPAGALIGDGGAAEPISGSAGTIGGSGAICVIIMPPEENFALLAMVGIGNAVLLLAAAEPPP